MFSEDIDAFFADFGTTATFGTESRNVLVDLPEQIFVGDNAISGNFQITFKTGYFTGLKYGSAITVNSIAYTVKTVNAIEDGTLSVAELSKV
jgi:hypothetical protein